MKIYKFGESQLGLPLHAYQWLTKPEYPHVLILGGVHGDEPEGVACARGLLQKFIEKFDLNLNLTLVPEMNPEGVLLKTRGNSNKVDLNRNLPTKDWSPVAATVRYFPGPAPLSEKENVALVQFIENEKPDVIFSLHSWKPMLNTNGDLPEAKIISEMTGYKIEPDIGYPTPGSLGTYAGLEKNIPTLTYEIERDIPFDQVLRIHVPAMIAGLKISQNRKRL
jgi:protein MpaA